MEPRTPDPRLVVIANRSPLRYDEDDGAWHPSIGGLATALLPVLEERGGVWVAMQEKGAPERQAYPEADPRFSIRRVPMTEEEVHNYYDGMANSVLWPLSHYLLQHLHLERAFIQDYRRINQRFAEAVVEEVQPGDQVWVQDYHLMLLPELLRERIPDVQLAHFWHIPWPAMEVFRIVPWARELIRGLLGCDLIGFHVEEYVENFLEGARTLLGAEVRDGAVRWQGREVRVEAHPIGVEVERFETTSASAAVVRQAEELRQEIGTEHLIVGVDRLDYTKGILERLGAFERFLKENEDYRERVTLYQIATPSRTRVGSYQELKREVDETVGRINGAFSRSTWVPVRYNYRSFTQEELCVFYRAADVCLTTPLRDGMNLVAHEYVAATEHGVLALSELAGAAYLLPEALLVNPYDEEGMARTLKAALEMPADERADRLAALKPRVAALDVHRWAGRFLRSLSGAPPHGKHPQPPEGSMPGALVSYRG
jgi:trehalose 6-phosphate synthase/phosphatase